MSALNPSRNTTRVQAPPGGHSTISFGGETPLSPGKLAVTESATPSKAVTPPEDPVAVFADAEVLEVEAPAPVEDSPSLETLKLQAIGAIAGATDVPDVREAMAYLIKQLQNAADAKAAKSEVVATSVHAADAIAQGKISEIAALKEVLKLRGTNGIISIGKKFRSLDDSGDRKLAYDEFKKGMVEMKLHLSEADMTRVFRKFDGDGSGFISFDELLMGLRGQLSERRGDMVARCFKVLDKTGDGKVTLADLERRYDASRHPDVVAGTKSQRMVLLDFLGAFEAQGGGTKGDGQVDLEEFRNYYAMISANIDEGPAGDDYFELMLRNVWHISGGEGWCANTTCKRVLVVGEDDSQRVLELTDDFDVDVKDLAAVKAKLAEQGITGIKSVALYGDMGAPTVASPSLASEPGSMPRSGRKLHEHIRSSIVFG